MQHSEPAAAEVALLNQIREKSPNPGAAGSIRSAFTLQELLGHRDSAGRQFAEFCGRYGLPDHSAAADARIEASVRRGAVMNAEHSLLSLATFVKSGVLDARWWNGQQRIPRRTVLLFLKELDRDRGDYAKDELGSNDPVRSFFSTHEGRDQYVELYRSAWKQRRDELAGPLEEVRELLSGARFTSPKLRKAIAVQIDKLPLEMWEDSRQHGPVGLFTPNWGTSAAGLLQILQGRFAEKKFNDAAQTVQSKVSLLKSAIVDSSLPWLRELPLHRDASGQLSEVGLADAEAVLAFRVTHSISNPDHAFGRPLEELGRNSYVSRQAAALLGASLLGSTIENPASGGGSFLHL